MKSFLFNRFMLVVPLLAAIPACTPKRDLTQNIVVAHILAEPKGLHPTNDNNAYQRMIFQCTQKRLLTFDLELNRIVPELLTGMPELLPDSISYNCRLRDDARWDDGTPVTLQDVLFTFKVIICPLINNPDQKTYLSNLRTIIPDPHDPFGFKVVNKQRYFDNAGMLSQVSLLQQQYWDPEGVFDRFGIEQLNDPRFTAKIYPALVAFAESFNNRDNGRVPAKLQGLGPYRVSDWQTGSSVTLLRKENWWGEDSRYTNETAWPEKIIFRVIKDMEPVVLGFKKQEIDVSTELSTTGLVKLQQRNYFNRNYHSDFIGSFTYTYLGLNMRPEGGRKPFFTDRNVRRAMAHLVPVEELIQVSAKGQARRIPCFALPDQQDFDKNLPLIPFDIEKARQLLDEAGWKDTDGDNIRDKMINGQKVPFSFALSYMASPVTKEIALLLKNSLYKAGIDARPEPMDFSVFYQNAFNHQFDAMLGSWSTSAEPEDPRQLWHTESWVNKGSNFVGFGNAYTDSLIEGINREMNPEKRSRMMKQFQALVWEEQPYVFLFNATRKIAVHKRFENSGMYPERPNVLLNKLKLIHTVPGSTPDVF